MLYAEHNYPILIAQSGPLEGQRWLIKSQLVIGRDDACDIIIPDRQVSRQHAHLLYTKNGVILEDLESKNGTFINSRRILEAETLKEGDELQVALVQHFVFISSDATLPLEDLPQIALLETKLRIDQEAKRVWVRGIELDPPLSISQFNLLNVLYNKPGAVVNRTEIIKAVWDSETEWVSEQALDALVRRLRERLSQIDDSHDYIITVRGHGFRLDN